MKLIGLVAVHNRIDTTKNFLYSLKNVEIPDGIDFELYMLDDGSTDGTSLMVEELFPEVNLLIGDGENFWAGGMRKLWNHISCLQFDFVLTLNDDIKIYDSAFNDLLSFLDNKKINNKSLCSIVGASENENGITYGGVSVRQSNFIFIPVLLSNISEVEFVDTFNMNFSVISRHAMLKTNFLSDKFTHHRADYDFGLRLLEMGGDNYLMDNAVCYCDRKWNAAKSMGPKIGFIDRYRALLSPKEQPVLERYHFYSKYVGRFWFIGFIAPYVMALNGALYRRLRGNKRVSS